jgi:protein phosphatase
VARRAVGSLVVVAIVVAGTFAAWRWIQHQYFVGARQEAVAIFRGLPEAIGPLHLAWVDQTADDVLVTDLPVFAQEKVKRGIPATSHAEATGIVESLRQQAADCRAAAAASSTDPAAASPTPTDPAAPPPTPSPALGGTLPPLTPSASTTVPPPTATQAVGPTASTTVGTPVIAVNPQATPTGVPSPSASPVGAGCAGLAP